MATLKERLVFGVFVVLLTLVVLYPILKETRREQEWGLLLTKEDVKGACGNPESDTPYRLTYTVGGRYMELTFFETDHHMFLKNVKFHAAPDGLPSGVINVVTREQLREHVRKGWLPACIEQAVQ